MIKRLLLKMEKTPSKQKKRNRKRRSTLPCLELKKETLNTTKKTARITSKWLCLNLEENSKFIQFFDVLGRLSSSLRPWANTSAWFSFIVSSVIPPGSSRIQITIRWWMIHQWICFVKAKTNCQSTWASTNGQVKCQLMRKIGLKFACLWTTKTSTTLLWRADLRSFIAHRERISSRAELRRLSTTSFKVWILSP